MKRLPSPSSSSEPTKKKLKFSQSEVQILIEQEVRSVLKKSETKLQGLLETIQQLDREIDYESSIQKLEARVNMVTQRAEAALAHMAKIKTQQQSCGKVDTIADSQDESKETTPQLVENNKSKELSHIMETTKKALKKMHTDKEALTAAIADLSEEQSPPILTPHGTPEFEKVTIKNEHENSSRKENHFETVAEPKVEAVAEPKVEAVAEPKVDTVKKECCSPDVNKGLKHRDPQQDEPMCPPLPTPPFPSILSMEAALYNIPPKPKVHLALIKNPARLSVLWDVEEKDPSGPPMDNYTVYMTMEKDKGSGVFIKWTTLGVVEDRPLPICVMVSKYKPGYKICFAVVGKDKFGRYGPYSDVVTANIP